MMGGGDDEEVSGKTETGRSGACADGAEANGANATGARCWKEVKMDLGTRMGGEAAATTKMATEVRTTTT